MSLTTQEFLNKLQRVRLNISEDDTPLKLASYSVIAKQAKRIFTDGLNANGSEIGQYSTKDIWINPDPPKGDFVPRNSGGFTPTKGKTGKSVFASTGEPHKTSYFKGWKGLREAQGLPTDNVKLDFTGELFSDFCNPQGGTPTTRKVSNTERVTSLRKPLSVTKLQGAEERYKAPIGTLTEDERQTFFETVRFEMRKLIKGS